jgi:hypothetical protein
MIEGNKGASHFFYSLRDPFTVYPKRIGEHGRPSDSRGDSFGGDKIRQMRTMVSQFSAMKSVGKSFSSEVASC